MIRPYDEKRDWSSVAVVYTNCFGPEFTLDLLLKQIKLSRVFVYERYGTMVVGYLLMTLKNGSPYVNQVAVHSGYRGIGLGVELLSYAETVYADKNLDSKNIWLEVEANNRAQTLYFNHGTA